jgi:20S proteasome subunit beta 1
MAPYDSTAAVQTGTTIMAAVYNGGVVMGADSRTSTGNYVANRVTDKITSLAENVYICRSGSAADTQTISDYVRHLLHQQAIEQDGLPEVQMAANIAMQLAYGNKNSLSAGLIVAGWDEKNGPSVWAIPLGGSLIKVPFTVGGSGSAYVLGWCDKNWKPGMTREECEAFVRKTVSLAIARDGSSGGMIRTLTINDKGAHRHLTMGHEVPVGWDEIQGASQGR